MPINQTTENSAFSIDAVYLWVDGKDPHFQSALDEFSPESEEPFALSPNRFSDHNELKYSLRSLHQNCPWIRQIFIVTPEGIKPPWLDVNHPKINLIHHHEFFPKEAVLPTFQSDTIQSLLHRIENLSEHFILLDDDFFMGQPQVPSNFFTQEGKAKCTFMRFRHNLKKSLLRHHWSPFDHTIDNTNQLIRQRQKQTESRRPLLSKFILNYGLHQASAFRKTALAALWKDPWFKPVLTSQMACRFRSSRNIQPILLSKYMAIQLGVGVLRPPPDYSLISLTEKAQCRRQLLALAQQPPELFCLNDMLIASDSDTAKVAEEMLNAMFISPSPYELESQTM